VISLRPTPEAYQEYGRLLNRLGDSEAAADAFREGLNCVAKVASPELPLLHADPAPPIRVPRIGRDKAAGQQPR
jgi:hypothetical protein